MLALAAALFLGIEPAKAYPRGDLLLDGAELKKNLAAFRVLDVRTRASYQAGHVPGAVWVSHLEWSRAFNNAADPKAWSEGQWGESFAAISRNMRYRSGWYVVDDLPALGATDEIQAWAQRALDALCAAYS